MVDVADIAKTVQPEDQNAGAYLSWSKGIQEPKYPSPGAAMSKGIEDAVKQGTSEFNKMFEQEAENRGLKAGEEAVSNYLPAVEAVDQTLFPQDKLDQVKDNLTSSGGPKAPSAVDAGINDIGKATAAYNQGTTPGHIRETMYYGTLVRKAQELRAQWPGYRDYIDKGIEKATGVSPTANHYIKSMLQDINEVLTKKNTNDQFILHKIIDEEAAGNPSMRGISAAVQSGGMSVQQGLAALNKATSLHYAGKVAEDNLHVINADEEEKKVFARRTISQQVPGIVHQNITTALTNFGLTPEILADPNKTQEVMTGLGEDGARTMARNLAQLEQSLRADLNSQYNKPIPEVGPDGKPTGRKLPGIMVSAGKDYNSNIESAFEEFKHWKDAFENPHTGYINEVANSTKAIENKTVNNVWNTQGGGSDFLKGAYLFNKFGSQGFAGLMLRQSDAPNKAELGAFMGNAMGGSHTSGLENLKATIQAINGKGSNVKPDPTAVAKTVKAYTSMLPAAIMDSGSQSTAHVTIPQAIAIAQHMFSGANNNWLDEIKGGRHAAYAKMSDPGFITKINELSKFNPQIGDDYRNWMKRTFADDIFRNDLDYIHTLQQDPGVLYSFYKGDNTHPPRFEVRRDMSTLQTDPAGYQASAVNNFELLQNRVDNFNKGIAAIHNVLGNNASDNLYNLFLERGMDTTAARSPSVGSSTRPDIGLLLSMKYARRPDPKIKGKNQEIVN